MVVLYCFSAVAWPFFKKAAERDAARRGWCSGERVHVDGFAGIIKSKYRFQPDSRRPGKMYR